MRFMDEKVFESASGEGGGTQAADVGAADKLAAAAQELGDGGDDGCARENLTVY